MKLRKDRSIWHLVHELDLRRRGWEIHDHWEADLFAIGVASLSSNRRLVYISTWKMPEGRFYYECELLPEGAESDTDYIIVDESEDVDIPDLLAAMERHLGTTQTSKRGRS